MDKDFDKLFADMVSKGLVSTRLTHTDKQASDKKQELLDKRIAEIKEKGKG